MKKIIISILASVGCLCAYGQALHIYHDGEREPAIFAAGGVDSVTFELKFIGSTEYQHVFHTKDGVMRFNTVDSVKFNQPYLVMTKHSFVVPNENGYLALMASGLCDSGEIIWADVLDSNGGVVTSMTDHSSDPDGRLYGLLYNWNSSGVKEPRTEEYKIYSQEDDKEYSDTFSVFYTGESFCRNTRYYSVMIPYEGSDYEIDTDWSVSLPDAAPFYTDRGIKNPENLEIISPENGNPILRIKKNPYDKDLRFQPILKTGDFLMDRIFTFIQYGRPFKHSAAEHRAALKDLYDNCNGVEWRYNQEWLSDKPLWEWDLLNRWGSYFLWYMDRVGYMSTKGKQYTYMEGTLPESFVIFMDDTEEINIFNCGLRGVIPYSIRHHEKWPVHGWNIIQQSIHRGGGFDMEDINLRIDDVEIENFVDGTRNTTYQELKKNKITWVFNSGMVNMIDGISDERVNKYLDYKNKGLGVAVTVHPYWDETYENYKNWVIRQQQAFGLPKEIGWTKSFDKADIGSSGSMSILDSEGNLLWYKGYIYSLDDPNWDTDKYINDVDSVCRKYLGEPEEHELYVSRPYESTDFSEDGRVLTIQKASVGKGIDLVIMGDQYVDTTMVAGGIYEQEARRAMDRFFSVEPYKSLQNRFNVYAVKVVSRNGYDGPDHALHYDDNVVFRYAATVPDVDMNNVTIAVISHNPNLQVFVNGMICTNEDGASIAYVGEGDPGLSMVRLAGGFGFGGLADESIEEGFEDNKVQPGAEESFRDYIETEYHDRGRWMNVSATDDPAQVPWARFLQDERYKDEVGIYEGAVYWPHNLWRPSESSIMKTFLNGWFNVPSREAIYKRVMKLSEGEGWTYDYETFVAFDREAMKDAGRINVSDKSLHTTPKKEIVRSRRIGAEQQESVTPNNTLNIPADVKLVPIEEYEGDMDEAHPVNINGVLYILQRR